MHTNEDLLSKVRRTLQSSGYPLELEVAALANKKGWVVFHACEYQDAETGKYRELDLMLYKLINNRRVELRISCKSSLNKQFVFFTHDRTEYIPMGELKCTPLVADVEWKRKIRAALSGLALYSHPRGAINYSVLSGDRTDREARALLRDAIMSVVSSTHYRLLPHNLLRDERGMACFFVVVLRGSMYEAHFDEERNELAVAESDYAVWNGMIPIPERYWDLKISDAEGGTVPFRDAYYWFGPNVHVEVLRDTKFSEYLDSIESAFSKLNREQQLLIGKGWSKENFPKTTRQAPSLKGRKPNRYLP